MKYIPLISSRVAGPLGVLHLPRLWQKVLLKSLGKLAYDYPDIGPGFDTMVCKALNLDPDAVRKFIAERRPAYREFENWVEVQDQVKLDRATIDASNRAILGYNHNFATRSSILETTGYTDNGYVSHSAIQLNQLEDWQAFHAEVLAAEKTTEAPAAAPASAEPVAEAVTTSATTATTGAPDSD